MKATGLGIELSPIMMFLPLLISESSWKEMKNVISDFAKSVEDMQCSFSARFDMENSLGGKSIELFHKLRCEVAKEFKLSHSYSKDYEKRTTEGLVSSLFGLISLECGRLIILK